VVHDDGIDKISLNDYSVSCITKGLALSQIEMNDAIVLQGKLWVTTNIGLLSFPITHTAVSLSPKLILDAIYVNGEKVDELDVLNYQQNNLSFHFDMINYSNLGLHDFRYRLLGYDDNWQKQAGSVATIQFISLPAGEYTLEFQAMANGKYSAVYVVHFTINGPFWLSGWVIMLEIIFGILLLWWVYRLAEKRTRARQLIKEKLALSQLTALRSQMNPHFLFNVLNSVQGLIYANKKTDATEYLGKFSDLMRSTLEMSNKKVISLAEEMEMLKVYIELESGRFEEGFEYELLVEPNVNEQEIKIPTMIVQPFVENAIKHGLMHKKGPKKLLVRCRRSSEHPEHIVLEIEDNGIGRHAANELNKSRLKHNSFATKAIDSRIHLLNQSLTQHIKIEWEDKVSAAGQPKGTLVRIIIPLHL
jgi:anti-sigma regulatory factor (Ser/Thr protein kinase)